VWNSTSFTITGLTGSQTPDNLNLNISTEYSGATTLDHLEAWGRWTQSTGMLEFTVSTMSQADYSGGHWEANTPVVFKFPLLQSATDQLTGAVAPQIYGNRTFAPWQFGPGDTKAPWWENEQHPIPLVNMTKPTNDSVLAIESGWEPLVCRVPVFTVYNVSQSNPFIGYANTITVSFALNLNLEAVDVVKLTLGGLQNVGLTSTPSFETHNWKQVSGWTYDSTYNHSEFGDPSLTNATLGTDGESIIWTLAEGQTLERDNIYVLHFNITNPLVAQEPNIYLTILSEKILNNRDYLITPQYFNFSQGNAVPNEPLQGVTNGLNAMKIVVPFDIRHFDDSVDTPLAPNVITVNITTRIAFVAGDHITISGVFLGHTNTAQTLTLADVANSATTYWGTTAVYNGVTGEIVFTVTATMDENTGYVFTMTGIVNPVSSNTVPVIAIGVDCPQPWPGGPPRAAGGEACTAHISPPVNMTQSPVAAATTSFHTDNNVTNAVTTPFTIVDPVFDSILFSPGQNPGNATALTLTFTANDEVATTLANSGIVTISLPGFTGGDDNGISSSLITSNPADLFDRASYTRTGGSTYLQLTTKEGHILYHDQMVVVYVPDSMGIKLPADGIIENNPGVVIQIGPRDWSAAYFSVNAHMSVVSLISGLKVNSLSAKGGSGTGTVATIPRNTGVQLRLEENRLVTDRNIMQTGDMVSLRYGLQTTAAWGCYDKRGGAEGTERSANLTLTNATVSDIQPVDQFLSFDTILDASNLRIDDQTGTTYTLCYQQAADAGATGPDSETNVTIKVQNKVTFVELNSNGVRLTAVPQMPRNDFTTRIYGISITATDQISWIPDAEDCTTQANTPLDVTHSENKSVTVDLATSSNFGTFAWPACIPTTSYPIVMDSANCPTAGVYRLCYNDTTNGAIETGISGIIMQAQVNISHAFQIVVGNHGLLGTFGSFPGTAQGNETFGMDFVHTVYTPFEIQIRLHEYGSWNAPCCQGTKVLLALNKAGADASNYLYNAAGSNLNADKIVVADASGIATFTGYTIRGTAGRHFSFTASVAGSTYTIPEGAGASSGFIVAPHHISVNTTMAEEFIVGESENAVALLTTPIVVAARDHLDNILEGLVTADTFGVEAMLQTGAGGWDSSTTENAAGVQASLTSTDLEPAASQHGGTPVVFNAGVASFADFKIAKQAGLYFRIKFTMTQFPGDSWYALLGAPTTNRSEISSISFGTALVTPGYTPWFKVSPAKFKLSMGATPTAYTASTFPKVIRLDGGATETVDIDGLPPSITIELLDAADAVLTSSNCTGCFAARLVKCTDSTPTNGTLNGDGVTIGDGHLLPACTDQAINASSPDQMAGMRQARCATQGGACSLASDFLQTLSSNSSSVNGTMVDVVGGTAMFQGLQARYTFGSGFLLRFVFNPTAPSMEEVASAHNATKGNVFFPDLGADMGGFVTADHTSLLIRPYTLEVVQHPGGDGIDLDGLGVSTLTGDSATNTPDGVGANQPFRVQPAVAVKGMGEYAEYYFDQEWNNHGHLPVTAVIKSATCGAECVTKGLVLTGGNQTGVSLTALQSAALVNTGTNDAIGTFSGDAGADDVELKWEAVMGRVGMVWKDLSVMTSTTAADFIGDIGFEGLQLFFAAGYNTNNLQVAADLNNTAYSYAESGMFDVFVAPDPPVNLRAVPYGELGFRVEFDPGPIARLKPLSGFIIEMDICEQSGAASGSCALQATPQYTGIGVSDRSLGSDYFMGGGRTEEAQLSYNPMTAATATAVTINIYPDEHIYGGDTLQIDLGLPGLIQAVGWSGTCTPEGTHAAYFTAASFSFNENTSVVSLEVVAGKLLPRLEPIQVTLPTGCELIYPETGLSWTSTNTNLGSAHTGTNMAAYQASRYGTFGTTPLRYAVVHVIGAIGATNGDNCKNVTCTVSSTKVLPTVQDGSSMDLSWTGNMQFGATGAACDNNIEVPMDTTSVFPAKRFCAMYSTGSNDPDPNDSSATNFDNPYVLGDQGNSGPNGAPIGRNPGRAGRASFVSAAATVTTGTYVTDSSAACRAGTNTANNPCALPGGEDWNTVATMSYTYSDPNVTAVEIQVTRDRGIYPGNTLTIQMPSATNADGSVDLACTAMAGSTALTNWTCMWTDDGTDGYITVTAGDPVPKMSTLTLTTTATIALTKPAGNPFPNSAVAAVNTGAGRVTILFRNGSSAVTYTSAVGDPIGSYTESTYIAIPADTVVTFRAYAYNGRFRSAAATTPIQSRAVQKPDPPSYFAETDHSMQWVHLTYGAPNASIAVAITMSVTPTMDLFNGTTLDIHLPGFTSAAILRDITTDSTVFPTAQWNNNLSTLVLKVAAGMTALTGVEQTITIADTAGIIYPSVDGSAIARQHAKVNSFSLYWVSPFPLTKKPRKGFVIQATTDRNWLTDIHTLTVPDKLNNGAEDLIRIGYLQADITDTQANLTVADPGSGPALDWLVGQYIKVDLEVMLVSNVSAGLITVTRSQRSTNPVAHTQITGGGTCACDAAGAATGTADSGLSCACTEVKAAYLQATDPSIGRFNGFDKSVGTAGNTPAASQDGCKIGAIYWPLGCNIRNPPVQYEMGLRSFQNVMITPGRVETQWLTNCGSTSKDTCTSGFCQCATPTLLPAMDLGAPVMTTDKWYPRTTGDPLDWPTVPVATVALEIADATVQHIALTDASQVDATYIRVDDELMYVHGPRSRGILRVDLYQPSGTGDNGATCGCGVTGNVTGGGTCSCYPDGRMTGCGVGGGLGFRATFTVADAGGSGYIDSITVTDPGYGYIAIPDVVIIDGGDNCSFVAGQALTAVLSTQVVNVERGAVGTTATNHSLDRNVSTATWPLRSTVGLPGAQYHFRVASYNDAGVSDYLYFTHAITQMNPNQLPTVGGQTIEVVLEGGGAKVGNTSVYIGHTHLNGSIDFDRSKLCGSLVVSDIAGTRLTCVSPPWVGRQHDIMVRYASGDFEKLSVASNQVSFPKPTIKVVDPAQVNAGLDATITITGTNFGTNQSDVVAELVGGTGRYPCSPLVLVSDSSIICTLPWKSGVVHVGTFVVGVGTDWSGGQQNTTETTVASIKEFDPPAEIKLTIAKDITEIPPASPARVQFVNDFTADLSNAIGIPDYRINVTDIVAGSVVVVFVILPDPNSATTVTPAAAAAIVAEQAADPTSALLTGAVTSATTGVSVPAAVLEAAAAAASSVVTATVTVPEYFKQSEPREYTLPNMEQCMYTCRLLCETGNEVPAVNGFPALPLERPRVCKSQCMTHCGFGRPFTPGAL